MTSLAKLTFTPEVEKKAEIALPMVYPVKWMKEKAEDDPQGRTNFEVEAAVCIALSFALIYR